MEKHSVESGNGSRLASLIDRRLRGDQQLLLVSVDSGEPAGSGTRDEAGQELLAHAWRNAAERRRFRRQRHRAAGQAIDDTIADVRASRP